MSDPDKNLGRRVGDRFVVEASLGAGGMGSIYRGSDERLGGAVAIKFLKHALLQDSIVRERFRREALSLARLQHPGIVKVLDFGEAGGELYTVLELVQGQSLDELVGGRGSALGRAMPLLRAGPIFAQILRALEVCHEHEIVHRDIKPSNVMVSSVNGVDHVTIIDFGLARMGGTGVDKLTETGAVQGTPHYMAPEQCRGEEVSPATDVYSVGVLFYEVLAGAEPFQGKDAATFMAQHLFVDPPPLRQVAPHVSPGVAAVVHSALAKQPHDRPTARELRAALASACDGTDPEALSEAATALRQRSSGLSRSERAITGRPRALATMGGVLEAPPTAAPHEIIVWMQNDDRSATLRGCLGAAGLACSLWTENELPPIAGASATVVLSAKDATGDSMDRIRRLRTATPKVVVVVVDVCGPTETTAAIRAGASDMLLSEAPDADLPAKLNRLLRRRAK